VGRVIYGECEGHPAGPFDPMGETAYCDGRCNPQPSNYANTVSADPRAVAPTERGK
jgi:hypothetical protein